VSNLQTLSDVALAQELPLTQEEIRAHVHGTFDQQPRSTERDAVANWVALQHFALAPDITDVYYLPHNAPLDELRLVEVNRLAHGIQAEVEAVEFGFDVEGLDYRLMVVDLSEAEHELLKKDGIDLPAGWSLNEAWHWGKR
jgi:hypothetical protein